MNAKLVYQTKIRQINDCIHDHRSELKAYLENNKLKVSNNHPSNLMQVYDVVKKYIYHYLLLVRLLINNSQMDHAIEVLKTLFKEITEGIVTAPLGNLMTEFFKDFQISSDHHPTVISGRIAYISLMKIVVTIVKYAKILKQSSIRNQMQHHYLRLVSALLFTIMQEKDKAIVLSQTYFSYAISYAYEYRIDISEKLFNQALIYLQTEYSNPISIACLYNNSLIAFVMGNTQASYRYANEALNKWNNLNKYHFNEFEKDKDNEKAMIHIILCQIQMEKNNYFEAGKQLTAALHSFSENDPDGLSFSSSESIECLTSGTSDENTSLDTKNRLIREIGGLLEKISQETSKDSRTDITKSNIDKILNYLNESIKKKTELSNALDMANIGRFFIFLTKLSLQQLLILNETQANMPSKKRNKLPITFSKLFKATLTPSLIKDLDSISITSLIRNRVLNDDDSPITLNYDLFNISISFCDIRMKDMSYIKRILENIYIDEGLQNQLISPNRASNNRKSCSESNDFKYNDKYNLIQLKDMIHSHASNQYNHSIDKKPPISLPELESFMNSILFIRLLNHFELDMIMELEQNPSVALDIINEYFELKHRHCQVNERLDYEYNEYDSQSNMSKFEYISKFNSRNKYAN